MTIAANDTGLAPSKPPAGDPTRLSHKSGSFTRATAIVLGSQITRTVSLLIVWAVVGRTLGPDALGQIQLAYVFPLVLTVFLSFGLPIANTYFLGRGLHPIAQILGNNLIWSTASSVAVILVLSLGRHRFSAFVPVPAGVYTATLVWIPVQQLRGALSALLIAQRRFSADFRLSLIQGIATIAAVTVAGYLFKISAESTVWLLVGLTGVIIVCQFWLYRHSLGSQMIPSRSLVRESFTLGFKGYLGNTLQYLNYRFDVFVVGYFSGAAALGYYAVAYTAAELLWYVPQAAATVLMPATASSSPESATSRTSRVCRISLVMALATALVAAALAPWATRHILGEKFVKSVPLIWILLPGVVAFVCAKILAADLAGRGRPEYGSYGALGGLIITLAGNLLFVPHYGPVASATISSLVYSGQAAFFVICYCLLSSSRPWTVLIPNSADLDIISGLASATKRKLHSGIAK